MIAWYSRERSSLRSSARRSRVIGLCFSAICSPGKADEREVCNAACRPGPAGDGFLHHTSKGFSSSGRIASVKVAVESSGFASPTRGEGAGVRECPLCGALERRPLVDRDGWQIVACAACNMAFIGNQLTYAAQIEAHDWLDDYPREMSRRKERHPYLLFLSRYTRRLRPETNRRLLKQT